MTDWRNAADYAPVLQLSRAGQAFEFLRRHPDYQKDYLDVLERRAQLATRSAARQKSWLVSTSDSVQWVTLTPMEQATAEIDPHANRLSLPGHGEQARMHFEDYYAWKYGLDQPLPSPAELPRDPPRFLPSHRFPFLPDATTAREHFYGEDPTEEEPPVFSELATPNGQRVGLALLCFDLTRSVKAQIQEADRILKVLQRQQLHSELIQKGQPGAPNYHPTHLVLLLRVWDALQANVAKEKVFAHLVEENEHLSESENPTATVSGWLEQARAIIYGRYRRLAHTAST